MTRVGIIGASGFTGAELLRICAGHPELEVVVATGESQAGTRAADLYPGLRGVHADLVFETFDLDRMDDLDLVFLGLPHGASQALMPELAHRVKHVVDLAADFRLRDPAQYQEWYGEEHQAPDLIDSFVYGLPELHRDEIRGADAVAVPGCYPTTAALALAPLVREGLIENRGIIVDAASGASGAGRQPKPTTTFCTVDENLTAYGLLTHRHTPEIEQAVGASVLFTPHLAPMNRGILATCYARPTHVTSTEEVLEHLMELYEDEPFVVVSEQAPSTKATLGSNSAHLSARFDTRTGWVVVLAALDNLVKGASGQAVQCANLLLGLDETTGLARAGLYP